MVVGLGRNPHGLGIIAAASCFLVDLAAVIVVYRSGRAAFYVRLALDSLDVAGWSLALAPAPDVAALAATPLACEAGLRRGWRGLIVPAFVGGTATLLLLSTGRSLEAAPFLWPSVFTVGGWWTAVYLRARLGHQLRLTCLGLEAATGHAELAGMNSVAAGADTIVDLLTRTTLLLTAESGRQVYARLAEWKRALADASLAHSTYLGVALANWQRIHNASSPILAADVELSCSMGDGALLLSRDQARQLGRALDGLHLRGHMRVAVPSASASAAGRDQMLLVGGHRVLLRGDPSPPALVLDPGPIAFLVAGVYALSHSLPWSEAVTPLVTVPLAAAGAALALWSHRWIERRGAAGHADVLAAGLAFGAADAVLSTLAMHNAETAHLARFPFLLFLTWFAPLCVLYARDLSCADRWIGAIVVLGVMLTCFPLLPGPNSPAALLTALVWPALGAVVFLGFRDALDYDGAQIRSELERHHRTVVDEAYHRGKRSVMDLVASATTEARGICRLVRGSLSDVVAREVERRLDEIDARLGALRTAWGLSGRGEVHEPWTAGQERGGH